MGLQLSILGAKAHIKYLTIQLAAQDAFSFSYALTQPKKLGIGNKLSCPWSVTVINFVKDHWPLGT